jgi:protein-L-isoaspartate(D-aspartate) O-methyltransferase
VERHRFVPAGQVGSAYRNHPLPIGSGQTISQPYIVALSTDLAQPRAGQRVLEVGTGSGYQAAMLAEIVAQVYTIELIPALGNEAERLAPGYGTSRCASATICRLARAGAVRRIVVGAARRVPQALVDQLKPGRLHLVGGAGDISTNWQKRLTAGGEANACAVSCPGSGEAIL